MGALAGLAGGGISASNKSGTGDSSAGLNDAFQYNGAFQIGGSGQQTQSQSASQKPDNSLGQAGGNNTLLYVAIGLGAIGLVAALFAVAKS